MRMFSGSDDEPEDDSSMFGGAERREEKQKKLQRAKDIADGTTMGTFERDQEVWDMVKKIKESK